MVAIHERIGKNLQKIRKRRGWTFDKMAEQTGVSKGMLSQMEKGETQPTVTTVWRMATGLNVSFSSLLKQEEQMLSVVERKDVPDLVEDEGKCRLFLVFPFDPETQFETYTMILHPGANYRSLPHGDGVREFITVLSGELEMTVAEETFELDDKKSIQFSANVHHHYVNRTNVDIMLQVLMYYADEY